MNVRAFLLSSVAAVGLALGFAPQQASAHWEHRHVNRWDPACCRYVTVCERYWVADDPCGHDHCDGRTGGYGGYGAGGYGDYDPYRRSSSYRPGYDGYRGYDLDRARY